VSGQFPLTPVLVRFSGPSGRILAAYSAYPNAVLVPVAVILTSAYWWLFGAPAIWTSRGQHAQDDADMDKLGILRERLLLPAIEAELARSRRFGHEFALVLATVDLAHRRFDYHEDEEWRAALAATATFFNKRGPLDRPTDGSDGFALLLSSGPEAVEGLVGACAPRQASRVAEGEPGGCCPCTLGHVFPARYHRGGSYAPPASPCAWLSATRRDSRMGLRRQKDHLQQRCGP
jgi:hypothetical protein